MIVLIAVIAADTAVCEGSSLGLLVALLPLLPPNAVSLNFRDNDSLPCWLQLGFALVICIGTISSYHSYFIFLIIYSI